MATASLGYIDGPLRLTINGHRRLVDPVREAHKFEADGNLEPGYYKIRLRARGPFVPVVVERVREGRWIVSKRRRYDPAEFRALWAPDLDGNEWRVLDLYGPWRWHSVWSYLEAIDEDEFEWLKLMKRF